MPTIPAELARMVRREMPMGADVLRSSMFSCWLGQFF